MKVFLLISTFLLISFCSFAQNNTTIDSLKNQLQKNLHDTIRINLLDTLGWELRFNNSEDALKYINDGLALATKINYKKGIARLQRTLGSLCCDKGDYIEAISHYSQSLKINQELNDIKGKSTLLGNIGIVYGEQGDYPNALKYYFEALEIDRELGNKNGIAMHLGNIGTVYSEQRDYPNAQKYYFEALEIDKELGSKPGIAIRLGNIGIVYDEQGDYDNALKYYFEALEVAKELGNKIDIAIDLSNIGTVYHAQGDYPNAMKHYFEALEIAKELDLKIGIAITLGNIGSLYAEQKQYNKAEEYLIQALALCDSTGALNQKMQFEKIISEDLYTQTHRYKLAYQHHKKYTIAKDSLFNEKKSKDIGRLEQKHEFEMAEMERKKIEEKELRVQKEAKERRDLLQYSGIVLVLFSLFLGIFLLARRFRKIKEQKTHWQYTRITEATLFISFLIFFEFILVLLDPVIEIITGGEPAGKVLINALIAGLIFPLHTYLESIFKTTIIKTERSKWATQAKHFCWLVLLIGHTILTGFTGKIDSLKVELERVLNDTTRVKVLNDLAWEFYQSPDSAILLSKQALKLAEDLPPLGERNGFFIGNTHNDLGIYYRLTGDYSLSLSHHFKSLKIRETQKDQQGITISLSNIGLVYWNQGDYPKALGYYFNVLKTVKELENKGGIARVLGNIGLVYNGQGDYPKALEYYFKALKMDEEMGNKNSIARHLGNIGIVYRKQGDYLKALEYSFKMKEIAEDIGAANLIAGTLGNIGIVYHEQGDFPKALEYYFKALDRNEKLGIKSEIAANLGNIGSLYTQTGRFQEAEVYMDSALTLCKSIGALKSTMIFEESMSQLYDTTGRYKEALIHHKKYVAAKDSLFNEEKSKNIGRLEQKHEFEMAEMEHKKQEEILARIEKEKTERRNNLQYSAIGIGILLLFGSLFFLGRFTIPNWLVELSVFMPFLLLFEFTLVLLDPYIELYTQSEPAYILILNAILAGSIF
ncbi:MAG: tetratricopeptide repeat protein, partial [Bacteroidia bacterium]|nr:tetratricopeptide repeat protein [Bacteroidia bacterium]